MRTFLLIVTFCFSALAIFAQQDLVYQITPKEYSQLEKGEQITEKYLHTLVDSISRENSALVVEQLGYFIKAYPQEEALELEVIANHSITIVLLNNQKDFSLRVIDSTGQEVENATLFWENRRIPYHLKTKSYRLKNWTKKAGKIEVWVGEEVAFFDITDETHRYYVYENPRIPFKQRLAAPFRGIARWSKRVWWETKNWVEDGGFWDPYHEQTYKGYLVFNQPKFRPNDTLKIKGYFTNKKGKPLNRPLQLQLLENYSSKYSTTIKPTRKGVYMAEIALHDSLNLTLDKTYSVSFYDSKKHSRVKAHSFRLEDYQLDEVNYSLSSNKKTYERGEKIMIKAEGKFKTGQYIPDGLVRLVVHTNIFEKKLSKDHFYAEIVAIKDTLWQTEIQLSSQKATQILIPTDKLPKARIPIYVDAIFTNSNGEIHQKQLVFDLTKPKSIQFSLDGAYVKGVFTEGDSIEDKMVRWTATGGVIEHGKLVKLPYQEKVNGYQTTYNIYNPIHEELVSFRYSQSPDSVLVNGTHTGKDLSITIQNPRELPINFQLYRGKNLVEEGHSKQANIIIKKGINTKQAYSLKYQYFWGSQPKQAEREFIFYKKELKIAIEQPEKVVPGAQVPIKITVENFRGKKIKGVELTAGAINAKFGDPKNFSNLEIDYKISKKPSPRPEFDHDETEWPEDRIPMTQKWVDKTQLKEDLFYRLRYYHDGIYMQYDTITKDSFYADFAQFSPYLMKNGRAQPIYLIYCNNKLVYYHDVDDNPPYAFIGHEGYNHISIRTLDYIYEIDSVFLKNGQKLELAIDAERYAESKAPVTITKSSTTKLLSPFEKQLLQKTVLVLKSYPGMHQVFQGKKNIHIFPVNYYDRKKLNYKIAPFHTSEPISYLKKDGFYRTFYFEPNYSYHISHNRERLHEYQWLKDKQVLPVKLPLQRPRQIVYSPTDLKLYDKNRSTKPTIKFDRFKIKHLAPLGGIQLEIADSIREKIQAIIWAPQGFKPYVLHPNTKLIKDMAATYQLYLVALDSSYAEIEIELQENTHIFQELKNLVFKKEGFQKVFQLIKYNPPPSRDREISNFFTAEKFKQDLSLSSNGKGLLEGTIIEASSGEVLIGVSILIKGTTEGTVTDFDGNFSLETPVNSYTLEVTYTGFATQIIELMPDQGHIFVEMSESGMQLSEVVVTGLGIRKEKRSLGYGVQAVLSGKIVGVNIEKSQKKLKSLLRLNKKTNSLPNGVQLRNNFKDHAFWQPNLVTDTDGAAYFTATFPDNFTQWNTFAIGMDAKKRAGLSITSINAFKPLTAQLAVPRFLIEGDTTTIIGKAINFTEDSLKISTVFKSEKIEMQTGQAKIMDALIEKMPLVVHTPKDTLTVSYQLKNNHYGDGEERKIPVFKKGIIENTGDFLLLEKDTIFMVDVSKKDHPLTIHIEGDIVDLLTLNVDYLIQYPHGCNEQTASKLRAVLLAKQIKKIQSKPFTKEHYIVKGIRRLGAAQNDNGSWGWWKGDRENLWMTAYVLKALHETRVAGYSDGSDFINKGLRYIVNNLSNYEGRDLLNVLEFLSDIDRKADYEKWLNRLDTNFIQTSLNRELTVLKIKQAQGLPHSLDNMLAKKQVDVFGNIYWGQSRYHWYNTDIQNSLLAYEILMKAGNLVLGRQVECYILRKRKPTGWYNTYQTAKILVALMKNNLEQKLVDLKENELIIIEKGDTTFLNNRYFKKTFKNSQGIQIIKKGDTPVYISAFQTFFNTNPTPKSDLFEVTSFLKQQKDTLSFLKARIPATIEIKVKMKRKAEYVMIEIPIPAGCSYGEKTQPKSWIYNQGRYQQNYEVHREYFKDRVAIYCRELPMGEYIYSINLEPRFTGNYTLNPTKVEEMYFPVFYGRNGMKKVEVLE